MNTIYAGDYHRFKKQLKENKRDLAYHSLDLYVPNRLGPKEKDKLRVQVDNLEQFVEQNQSTDPERDYKKIDTLFGHVVNKIKEVQSNYEESVEFDGPDSWRQRNDLLKGIKYLTEKEERWDHKYGQPPIRTVPKETDEFGEVEHPKFEFFDPISFEVSKSGSITDFMVPSVNLFKKRRVVYEEGQIEICKCLQTELQAWRDYLRDHDDHRLRQAVQWDQIGKWIVLKFETKLEQKIFDILPPIVNDRTKLLKRMDLGELLDFATSVVGLRKEVSRSVDRKSWFWTDEEIDHDELEERIQKLFGENNIRREEPSDNLKSIWYDHKRGGYMTDDEIKFRCLL